MNHAKTENLNLTRSGGRPAGFTLLEVLIVVIVLAVLAAVVVANFTDLTDMTKAAALSQTTQNVHRQIQVYHLQNGRFPVSHLQFESSWFLNGTPDNPFFPNQGIETENAPGKMHPDNIVGGPGTAGFWYNSANGVFRARVTSQGSSADTQQVYRTANGL